MTPEFLAELEGISNTLANMAVRVAELRDAAYSEYDTHSEVETSPWFKVAQRLSIVEQTYYIIGTLLEDASIAGRSAYASSESGGNVVQIRQKREQHILSTNKGGGLTPL